MALSAAMAVRRLLVVVVLCATLATAPSRGPATRHAGGMPTPLVVVDAARPSATRGGGGGGTIDAATTVYPDGDGEGGDSGADDTVILSRRMRRGGGDDGDGGDGGDVDDNGDRRDDDSVDDVPAWSDVDAEVLRLQEQVYGRSGDGDGARASDGYSGDAGPRGDGSDATGEADTAAALSPEQLASAMQFWSTDEVDAVAISIGDMLAFEFTVFVEVQLVGFDGDGNAGVILDPAELQRHFEVLKVEHDRAAVLHPGRASSRGVGTATGVGVGTHELGLSHRVLYRVSQARKAVARRVSDLVRTNVIERDSTKIPTSSLETILSSHYSGSALAYTFYVLNPTLESPEGDDAAANTGTTTAGDDGVGDGDVRGDEYSADASIEQDADDGWTPPLFARWYWYQPPEPESCASTIGAAAAQRFAWVDVTAGPNQYGPRTSGRGLVTAGTVPKLLSTDDGSVTSGFTANLAAFVHRSVQQLVTPPMHRFPVRFESAVHVRVVVISDASDGGAAATGYNADSKLNLDFASDRAAMADAGGWDALMGPLSQVADVTGQDVDVRVARVALDSCALCVAAIANARRSYTTQMVGGSVSTAVHEYIDSAELGAWMRRAKDGYWGLRESVADASEGDGIDRDGEETAGIAGDAAEPLIVPVFVFDFDTAAPLLLDRFEQAVAVLDPEIARSGRHDTGAAARHQMGWSDARGGVVVAVQTKSQDTVSDWICNGNARVTRGNDARRAVLASVLELAWGVAPTHVAWSDTHGTAETDYTWGVGRTPFGPFSESMELSFAIVDAAARHMLHSHLVLTLDEAVSLLRRLQSYAVRPQELLSLTDFTEFVRRWSLLVHKLNRASTFASLHDFEHVSVGACDQCVGVHDADAVAHMPWQPLCFPVPHAGSPNHVPSQSRMFLVSAERDLAALDALTQLAGLSLHTDLLCEASDAPDAPTGVRALLVAGSVAASLAVLAIVRAWRRGRSASFEATWDGGVRRTVGGIALAPPVGHKRRVD